MPFVTFNSNSYRGRGVRGGSGGRTRFQNRNINPRPTQIPPELIDPKKVHIRNINRKVTNTAFLNHLKQFADVVDGYIVKPPQKRYCYGFAECADERETKKLLSLTREERMFEGYVMEVSEAKIHIKVPGMIGYQRASLSDRDFDLEPLDADQPSFHDLNDDVILKVFNYLPIKNLVKSERVCRRWQNLVYINFRKRAINGVKKDLNHWFNEYSLKPKFSLFSKTLLLCGEHLTELTIHDGGFAPPVKIVSAISQVCPKLEHLTIHLAYLKEDFVTKLTSCNAIKQLSLRCDSPIEGAILDLFLRGLPNLRDLRVLSTLELMDYNVFAQASNLESLYINELWNASFLNEDTLWIAELTTYCKNLQVLHIENCRQRFGEKNIRSIGTGCSKLTEFGIEINENCDFSIFKNLTNLTIKGEGFNLNKLLSSVPTLESFKIEGLPTENESSSFIDFSVLPNLKILHLPWNNRFHLDLASMKSVSKCPKIEFLKFKGCNEHKEGLIALISSCPNLNEIYCPTVTLSAEDLPGFRRATRNRSNRIKLVIGLDYGALDHIESLNEAKYDIEMFDAHNLFLDDDIDNDSYYGSDITLDLLDLELGDDFDDMVDLQLRMFMNGDDDMMFLRNGFDGYDSDY